MAQLELRERAIQERASGTPSTEMFAGPFRIALGLPEIQLSHIYKNYATLTKKENFYPLNY
jgi:hypothetical protein